MAGRREDGAVGVQGHLCGRGGWGGRQGMLDQGPVSRSCTEANGRVQVQTCCCCPPPLLLLPLQDMHESYIYKSEKYAHLRR